ncbi:MAG: nucleotidyltransferase domain-containing protein [Planctomycetes bacterium]|nr:nucleotidyltransferase domain-containing protein [Planctomycetota bacterium]
MSGDRELVRHDLPGERRDELLRAAARALESMPGVRLAWAYGSFVRAERFRDLDLAVQFAGRPGWRDPGRVVEAVSLALERPPFEIDVVPLNDAAPEFRLDVARRGILLRERIVGEAIEFAALARSELMDLAEWRRALAAGR